MTHNLYTARRHDPQLHTVYNTCIHKALYLHAVHVHVRTHDIPGTLHNCLYYLTTSESLNKSLRSTYFTRRTYMPFSLLFDVHLNASDIPRQSQRAPGLALPPR